MPNLLFMVALITIMEDIFHVWWGRFMIGGTMKIFSSIETPDGDPVYIDPRYIQCNARSPCYGLLVTLTYSRLPITLERTEKCSNWREFEANNQK